MITKFLIAGVAIGALAASGASARTMRHHHARHMAHHMASMGYAAPAQPIPYAQVDQYVHGSASERRSMEGGGMSATGATASMPATESTTSPGADASVPASGGANPTTGEAAQPNPNNAADQVPSTGPDVQGNPVATPPPPPK